MIQKAKRNPLYELITHGFVSLNFNFDFGFGFEAQIEHRIQMKISFVHFESIENDEPHTRDKWIDRALSYCHGEAKEGRNVLKRLIDKCLYWAAFKRNQHSAFTIFITLPRNDIAIYSLHLLKWMPKKKERKKMKKKCSRLRRKENPISKDYRAD